MTHEVSDYWDEQAASFDEEPDHGGTGSLTLLLAQAGSLA